MHVWSLLLLAGAATVSVVHTFDSTVTTPDVIAWGVDGRVYGVFSSATANGGAWRLNSDGSNLESRATESDWLYAASTHLVRNRNGVFYGAAYPSTGCPRSTLVDGTTGEIRHDYGSLFRIAPSSLTPEKVLSAKLYCVRNGIAIGADDALYVLDGGNGSETPTEGAGALWRMSADENSLMPVRAFTANTDGANPVAVIASSDGWLYGVNGTGGPARTDTPEAVAGTLYRVRPDGSSFEVLHGFVASEGRPASTVTSASSVMEAKDGFLYGNLFSGGANARGALYRIAKDGRDFRILHAFGDAPDGRSPVGNLVLAGDGNIYGVTTLGGNNNVGALFRIVVESAQYELLHSFTSGVDGTRPFGRRLISSPNGRLYLLINDSPLRPRLLALDIGYKPANLEISAFAASTSTLTLGSAVALSWSVLNGMSCVADGAWSGAKNASGGSESVTPLALGDYSYSLKCSNEVPETVERTVSVRVVQPVAAKILSFSAQSSSVTVGSSVTLSWSTEDATACTAGGSWSGDKASRGSETLKTSATGAKNYTLNCTGTGGNAQASVSVTVTASPEELGPDHINAKSGGGSLDGLLIALLGLLGLMRWERISTAWRCARGRLRAS